MLLSLSVYTYVVSLGTSFNDAEMCFHRNSQSCKSSLWWNKYLGSRQPWEIVGYSKLWFKQGWKGTQCLKGIQSIFWTSFLSCRCQIAVIYYILIPGSSKSCPSIESLRTWTTFWGNPKINKMSKTTCSCCQRNSTHKMLANHEHLNIPSLM